MCTSAITRVRFHPGHEYSVEVELVPRDSWEKQIEQIAADIKASKELDAEVQSYVQVSTVPEDEKKRLIAVYGPDAYSKFLVEGDRTELKEPEFIDAAFQEGVISFSTSSVEDLRVEVGRYLTSKESYWPIVRTCLIRGPFEGISHGGELVDLPGLNDPNEAREELTRQFLETAKFVWVVFNMVRSLGRDLTQVLESRDLINRLLAGGRVSTLTFVGTHSDNVSSVNPEDFGLAEDASAAEIALARNEEAERELRVNLGSIAQTIALGGSNELISTELEAQFVKSPAFMVSASNHLQMSGRTKSRVPVIFEDPYETNIPQLSNHLKRITIEAGPKANAYSLVTSLEQVVSEMATIAQTVKTQLVLADQQDKESRGALVSEVRAASLELRKQSDESVGRLRRSLQEAVSRFRVASAIDRNTVERIVADRTSRWNTLHWATMRATASRGGRYASPTFGEQDFIRDLSAPLIGRSIGPWKEFFEKDLPILSRQVADGLVRDINTFCARIGDFGKQRPELDQILSTLLPDLAADVSDSVESAVLVVLKELNSELSRRQQELHATAEKVISESMAKILSHAASQSGTGMKRRMVDILSAGSKAAVSNAVSEFEGKLSGLAERAVKEVLDSIAPVVSQIGDKTKRIESMLTETASREDSATLIEIDDFLSRLSTVRADVSQAFNLIAEESEESPDVAATPVPALQADAGLEESLKVLIVDASNVARSVSGQPPSIRLLESCKSALSDQFDGYQVVMIADASLRHLVRSQSTEEDLVLFDELVRDGDLIEVPSGTVGKADQVILKNAMTRSATVISNDSYKEFQGDHPWLFDDGRLFGHSHHEALGWQFPVRKPVRQRSY